jgi:hypothetical protein
MMIVLEYEEVGGQAEKYPGYPSNKNWVLLLRITVYLKS